MKSNVKNSLFSVVVPIGNMVGQLRFIESWIHEIDQYEMEAILVHDQTYKEVGPEIEQLLASVNLRNVKLVEGTFGNPGSARNAGLEKASGEWIAFWDSDDNPNIENIWNAVQRAEHRDEVIIGNFTVFNLKTLALTAPQLISDSLNSVAMNPGIWRMIFRSETIGTTRFPSLKMGEDQVFLSHLGLASRKLKFIESVFYQYNSGGSSQLTKSDKALRDLPIASGAILNHAVSAPWKDAIFDLQLFFRQQITLIKKGNFLLKLGVLRFSRNFFVPVRLKLLVQALAALTKVLRTVKRAGI